MEAKFCKKCGNLHDRAGDYCKYCEEKHQVKQRKVVKKNAERYAKFGKEDKHDKGADNGGHH